MTIMQDSISAENLQESLTSQKSMRKNAPLVSMNQKLLGTHQYASKTNMFKSLMNQNSRLSNDYTDKQSKLISHKMYSVPEIHNLDSERTRKLNDAELKVRVQLKNESFQKMISK